MYESLRRVLPHEVEWLLNYYREDRPKVAGWEAHITCPTVEVTSVNGTTMRGRKPLEFACEAAVGLIGSS